LIRHGIHEALSFSFQRRIVPDVVERQYSNMFLVSTDVEEAASERS
jgi:hypothetical protein